MTFTFSEASKLLIHNWATVKDIHKAEGELASSLRGYLFNFELQLTKHNWWDISWKFNRASDTQVYIACHEWKRIDKYALWIGIENFTAETIFGSDGYAALYVWVSGNRPQLVTSLRNWMAKEESGILGVLQTKSNSSYVVEKPLRKCLPEEVERFDEIIGTQILDFFSFYGQKRAEFSVIVNESDKDYEST